jgi:hypothetical protein
MTNKDYELIADTIINLANTNFTQKEVNATLEVLSYDLINKFELDNPRFDKQKFADYINQRTNNIYIA